MIVSMLNYIRAGWPVLPIKRGEKRPLYGYSVYDGTTDEDTVCKWLEMEPNLNIGVPSGPPIGAFVVDVDKRHGGYESLAAMVLENGALPRTVCARTAGGGEHYLFKWPVELQENLQWRLVGKLAKGIDILGAGRYFLVEPSASADGGRYRWNVAPWNNEIAAAPPWLLQRVIRKCTEQVDHPQTSGKSTQESHNLAAQIIRSAPGAVSGRGGHNYTFALACRLVHEFDLSVDSAFSLMREWNFRCQPPWSERELRRKVEHAYRTPKRF